MTSRNFLLPFLVGLVAVIFVFQIVQRAKSPKTAPTIVATDNQQSQTIKSTNSTPTASVITTEQVGNTQRVTHMVGNYSIVFPSNWTFDGASAAYLAYLDPIAKAQVEETELLQGMKLEAYSESKQPAQTLAGYVAARTQAPYILSQKTLTIASRPAIQVEYNVLGYSVMTYIDRNNSVLAFIAYIPQEKSRTSYREQYQKAVDSVVLW